ncbi:MAG: phosphate signaling complex protein PhoU, partial [Mycobacteriales bacterium]
MLRTALHEEIQGILDGVVEMIGLVSAATSGCTQALLDTDVELAQRVISADGAINAIYRKLDERTYEVLALHAPVATDLRAVLATIRMIGDVERAGDLALNIAKIAVYSHPMSLPQQARDCVAEMDSRARDLLATAAYAVQHREPEVAERLDLMDDRLDDLRRSLYGGLLSGEWGADRVATVNLPLVARYYERIADHAVS